MSLGIIVPSDVRKPLAVMEFNSLGDYQRAVGGLIEAVSVGKEGLSFFANEEAKILGLECNPRATIFWWLHQHPRHGDDFLCGDAVLIGPPDEHGETQSVPELLTLLLFKTSTYTVEVKPQGTTTWHRAPEEFHDYFSAGAWVLALATLEPAFEGIRVVASP